MRLPFAQIEVTTRCNFTCGFCAGRHMTQGSLALPMFERFLAQVVDLEHLELQGEGEPLLHRGIFEMIALTRTRFPECGISLITNGSLLSEERVDRLLSANVTRVYISLESPDADRFQAIRGGPFQRVTDGIRRLVEQRNARGLGVPAIGLAITVLRSTMDDMFEGIGPLYDDLGLDGGVVVQALQATPQYRRYYDAQMQAEMLDASEEAHLRQRLAADSRLVSLTRQRQKHPGFYERLYASTGPDQCPWLANGLYIAQDGSALPCCFAKDTERFAIGSANDVRSAVEQRNRMAERLREGEIPPACEGCSIAQAVVIARSAPR